MRTRLAAVPAPPGQDSRVLRAARRLPVAVEPLALSQPSRPAGRHRPPLARPVCCCLVTGSGKTEVYLRTGRSALAG